MGLPELNGTEDLPIYDSHLLEKIQWESSKDKFDPQISPSSPGESLFMRPLSSGDYDRGFMQVLAQLTKVGEVSKKQFLERFESMRQCKGEYYVTVIEDMLTGQVIGSATLTIEKKFIRECALRGRLEDVVVSDSHRGRQLGKLLVETVTHLAKIVGCYKLSLDCNDKVIGFYEQLGYYKEEGRGNSLIMRLKD